MLSPAKFDPTLWDRVGVVLGLGLGSGIGLSVGSGLRSQS